MYTRVHTCVPSMVLVDRRVTVTGVRVVWGWGGEERRVKVTLKN